MEEDYYRILGIGRDADAGEVRRAYRYLARRLHPDVDRAAGSTRRFLKVRAAYEALSDERKRGEYDRRLAGRVSIRHAPSPQTVGARAESPGNRGPARRPFAPWEPPFDLLFDLPPAFQELLDRWFGRREDLRLEVILTPQEASRGGRLPIDLPARGAPFGGAPLAGRGWARTSRPGLPRRVLLSIPPGVRDGQILQQRLEPFGLSGALEAPVTLQVTIRIDR